MPNQHQHQPWQKKKNLLRAFPEGGLLSLAVYGANKDDKLRKIERIKKMRSVHDCQNEGGRLIREWDKGCICMYCMLKCMEMFLFGGFPCGAFGLQTGKIMNRVHSLSVLPQIHMVAIFYPFM